MDHHGWLMLSLVCALGSGCGAAGPEESDGRDTVPLLQTSELRYHLVEDQGRLRTTIPFTYTNKTPEVIHIAGCVPGALPGATRDRSLAMGLERQEGTGWQRVWGSIVPLCSSPPVVVQPGETYHDTATISGSVPGGRGDPKFEREDLAGVYRLVWSDLEYGSVREETGHPEHLPAALRISNAFRLMRQGEWAPEVAGLALHITNSQRLRSLALAAE